MTLSFTTPRRFNRRTGDIAHAALGVVIASLSVYLAATGDLATDSFETALNVLADVIGELREKTSGRIPSGRTLH